MTNPQTPAGDRRPPTSSPAGLDGRACTLLVPVPRDNDRGYGHTPAGTVEHAPVPAGHRKCQTPGCVAGMIRMSCVLDRGGPIHTLLVDDPACDATGLDLASYQTPGGATGPGRPVVPLGHQGGAR